jgi:hypothetical protein
MEDFIEEEDVYLMDARPYSMTVPAGQRGAGNTYKGWTYEFRKNGVNFKLSSDKIDLTGFMNESKEPVRGKLRSGIKERPNEKMHREQKLVSFVKV